MVAEPQQHFLLVGVPVQSQINPILRLAWRLTSLGVRVTFSNSVFAHRHMFPDNDDALLPLDDPLDPLISYHPYSDGYDDRRPAPNPTDVARYMDMAREVGTETLFAVATAASEAKDRVPVTCVVYALLVPWAAQVAKRLGVPSFLFWIQPASLFAVYYHYFHGYRSAIDKIGGLDCSSSVTSVELPGLPRLEARDLPSTICGPISHCDVWTAAILRDLERTYRILDEEIAASAAGRISRPKILVNSFDGLEEEAVEAVSKAVELIPVGPMLPPANTGSHAADLVKHHNTNDYMQWLGRWPERSIVYVSFGSFSVLEREQVDEFARAIIDTGLAFLWVLRDDIVSPAEELVSGALAERGKIVSWCDQVQVLAHPSVGCFVTHCGWNSTSEAIAAGVPMVAVPFSTDQPMNARLVEGLWRVGLRENVDAEGIVRAPGLTKCVQMVMGSGDHAAAIRRAAAELGDKARAAIKKGGSSDRNLIAFVNSVRLTV